MPQTQDLLKDLLSSAGDLIILLVAILLTAGSRRIKAWLEKRTDLRFQNSITNSSHIRDSLTELRALYEADRVMLFQLHNGQYYFSGEGADKLTMTHFVVANGIAPPSDMPKLQNIPITYWPDLFSAMTQKGYLALTIDEVTDPYARQVFTLDGVTSLIVGPVKDRRNYWRGVLVVVSVNDDAQRPPVDTAARYAATIADRLSL